MQVKRVIGEGSGPLDQDLRDIMDNFTNDIISLNTGPDHVHSWNDWPSLVLNGRKARLSLLWTQTHDALCTIR